MSEFEPTFDLEQLAGDFDMTTARNAMAGLPEADLQAVTAEAESRRDELDRQARVLKNEARTWHQISCVAFEVRRDRIRKLRAADGWYERMEELEQGGGPQRPGPIGERIRNVGRGISDIIEEVVHG